jgi:hypothetical protein
MPLWSINTNHVENWVGDLVSGGYSPATVRKAYQIFGGVIKSAIRARRIGFNPATGVSLPELDSSERRFLTAFEILALADVIDPDIVS